MEVHFSLEKLIYSEKNKIDAKVYSFKSIIRIVFSKKNISNRTQRDFMESKNKKIINKLKHFLFKKRIVYPSNGIIFFSDKTTFNDIKYTLNGQSGQYFEKHLKNPSQRSEYLSQETTTKATSDFLCIEFSKKF